MPTSNRQASIVTSVGDILVGGHRTTAVSGYVVLPRSTVAVNLVPLDSQSCVEVFKKPPVSAGVLVRKGLFCSSHAYAYDGLCREYMISLEVSTRATAPPHKNLIIHPNKCKLR